MGSVKRKLLKCNTPYISTFQTFNDGSIDLDPQYFYAYLQPELSEYDAWFNVKDTSKIGHYYQNFIAYMREHHRLHIEQQIKTDKWLMPNILPDCNINYGVGWVLFSGEIAGFLNPMGEGISTGMRWAHRLRSQTVRTQKRLMQHEC